MAYDPAMPDWPVDEADGIAPAPSEIAASRNMGWARLILGWISAQSLLTLIPIAPGYGVAGLSIVGAVFVAVALSGVARLAGGAPGIGLDADGLRLGTVEFDWTEVEGWRLAERGGRRLEIRLAPEAARRVPLLLRAGLLARSGRRLAWKAGDLTATLAETAAALRAVQPDLER